MKTLEAAPSRPDVHIETVTLAAKRPNRRWFAIAAIVVAIALIAGAIVFVRARSAASVSYETTPVVRGDVVQTVTATGTVNPQNTVAVGTQVSGTIAQINVDFNSHVRKGNVLARLDPTTAQASLDQANAALAQSANQARASQATADGSGNGVAVAEANARAAQASAQAAQATAQLNSAAIATADANVTKAQSTLALAQQTVSRDRQLLAQGYIAQSQLDADRSNEVGAQAGIAAAQAAAQQARLQEAASVNQAQASSASRDASQAQTGTAAATAASQSASAAATTSAIGIAAAQVQQAKLTLDRTIITSPVDGTVVARNVSVGQTVAASLSTPTLFSIAQNLNKMEVDLSVGEPDIGNVRAGDVVDFTVLAYPSRTFHGTVSQVRINPTTTSNVVTYTTVVLVQNTDGKLLPGMTANASIHVEKETNALTVPLAALSYTPPAGAARAHRKRSGSTRSTQSGAAPTSATPWGQTSGSAGSAATTGSTGRIFVLRGGALTPIRVSIDLVSGALAAVSPLRGTLAVGDAVITGDSSTAPTTPRTKGSQANNNPLGGRAPAGPAGRVLR